MCISYFFKKYMLTNTKKQEMTDDVGGGVVYYGVADPGTPTTSRKWAIWKEVTSSGDVTKTYPVGSNGVVSADEQFAWSERLVLNFTTSDDTTAPTLPTVTIASNNSDTTKAKVGDVVTLTIVGSEILRNVVAVIGGLTATVTEGADAEHFTAAVTIDSSVPTGAITFNIGFQDIGGRAGTNVTAVTGGSGVTVDKTAPTMSSASRTDNTHIEVTLSELATTGSITKANAGGFYVEDAVTPATTYAVSAIAPGADNTKVVLTVATIAGSQANGVKVKYTAGGNGTVQDTTGNTMATNSTGVTVAPW